MDSCFGLIIVLNALLGWFLISFLMGYSMKVILPKKTMIIKKMILEEIEKELGPENLLAKKMDALDLAEEVGPFLDLRLDQITKQMAAQIPMGELLLSGSLGQKMKMNIRNEIYKILPELKEQLIERVSHDFDLKQVLTDQIQSYDFCPLMSRFEQVFQKDLYLAKGIGALIGALTGVLEIALIFWLCK
ncbi:MAG: hypothetical protein ACHQUC_04330 [Chlamydiales bacterium]